MPLVIEDGSIVANADSYATVDEARTYADSRGLTLPDEDEAVEALLRNACDYLQGLEPQYKGYRVSEVQELAWPRQDVYLYGWANAIADDAIPTLLKNVQCQLAADGNTDIGLMPNGDGRQVIREKLDVIETEYADLKSGSVMPEFNKAMQMLTPLLKQGGGMALRTQRV